ncbi:hypothetical protein HHK36_000031 [Tetracentron sinense]|uniref:Cytochrome P450 n=1 Tax=Tetracentron sinense TaxID=13715 RepID=A0A834ZTD6_TETSI|nr:hypothetical protein HHK36_000031 [Tetracentron sinense]
METQIESFWVFALASKCRAFSSQNIVSSVFLMGLAWLAMCFLYWAYPGGPAWGKYLWRKGPNPKPIPGPRGFPLFGSMNLMASLAHHRLAAVAESFGAKRLMAFSLGETRVIITCNPDVAKEILNSSVFADRPVKESAYGLMFNRAIGFAPYGVYWRTLRRIAATHLFCPKQINGSETQRFEIAAQMVSVIGGREGEIFCVRDTLKRASLHNMMCSVFGRKYVLGSSNNETDELSGLVEEGYELLGKLNWSDHLPLLAGFDPQKIRFRCSKLVPKVNRFVNRIIAQHRAQTGDKTRDFVDVLLTLQGPDKLSDPDMVAVLWEMIFRGTDTVAVLIEWILARMVLHPDIQSKVHEELDEIVGKARPVTESDIPAMVFLEEDIAVLLKSVWVVCTIRIFVLCLYMARGLGNRGGREAPINDVYLRREVEELKQSNENLQRMMEEILRRLPSQDTTNNPGGFTTNPRQPFHIPGELNDDEQSDSSSSTTASSNQVSLQPTWAMDRLARALENADRSVRVDVLNFNNKLDPKAYCDWIASLETFFNGKK